MKIFSALFWVTVLIASRAHAQLSVTITIDAKSLGPRIPQDFAGISIFNGTQVRDHRGMPGNLFSGTNSQLITLFKNTGIRHLRLGATGSARSEAQNLSHEDIDSLFAFAGATGIKVIYSLHFQDGVATAKYVWDNYRPYVDYFAYDNEPDGRAMDDADWADSGSPGYFTEWRQFARSVVRAAPGTKFAGPDAAGRALMARFVKAEKDSGCLALITQHIYVDGNPRKKGIDTPAAIEHMLSADWVTNKYPQLYNAVLFPVKQQGFPFG